MINRTIKTKITLRNDDLSAWSNKGDTVLGRGEVALAFREDGSYDLRIGDGDRTWNNLDQSLKLSANQILGLSDDISAVSSLVMNDIKDNISSVIATSAYLSAKSYTDEQISNTISDYVKTSVFEEKWNGSGLSAIDGHLNETDYQVVLKKDIAAMQGAVHFAGVKTDLSTLSSEEFLSSSNAGDIVIVGTKEFICDKTQGENGKYVELGDEGIYLEKGVYENWKKDELEPTLSTLSNEISSKIKVGDFGQTLSSVQELSVVHIEADVYHQMVIDKTLNPQTIYVVEYTNIDAFGERIVNLCCDENTKDTDAVNKKYVADHTISGIKLNGESVDITDGIAELSVICIDCGNVDGV